MAEGIDLGALLTGLGALVERLAVERVRGTGIPELALGRMTYGPVKGDSGMLFERTCDTSYGLASGCCMCQAQRCSVAGPIWFAIPRSSPAGHGGAGTFIRCSFSGSAA